MRYHFLTIGKPKLAYARDGFALYCERLSRYVPCDWIVCKEGSREEESRRLWEASVKWWRVALDEEGKSWSSVELAHQRQQWAEQGINDVAFLIGGAEGHTDELLARCSLKLSLSKMTLQHELALVVLTEQLYRAETILRKHPYHRE